MLALRSRLFFYPRPIFADPQSDGGLVPLAGSPYRLLRTPSELTEQAGHVIRMVLHIEQPDDHVSDKWPGPSGRRVAPMPRSSRQSRNQLRPLFGREPRLTPRMRPREQLTPVAPRLPPTMRRRDARANSRSYIRQCHSPLEQPSCNLPASFKRLGTS